jgi:ferritin-like protein
MLLLALIKFVFKGATNFMANRFEEKKHLDVISYHITSFGTQLFKDLSITVKISKVSTAEINQSKTAETLE